MLVLLFAIVVTSRFSASSFNDGSYLVIGSEAILTPDIFTPNLIKNYVSSASWLNVLMRGKLES